MVPLSFSPTGDTIAVRVRIRTGTILVAAIAVIGAALGLAGCSNNNQNAFEGTGSPHYQGSGPVPHGGGIYKVGNPYEIAGRTYYPHENTAYDETGTASWYGEQFHRRQTANGEYFDMNRLTAAHPTLPMPIYARVTNLDNNKSIVVRINDRGPYAHDRIIDLSRAAANELGFIRQGTAPVRVQFISVASLDDDGSELTAMNRRLRDGTLSEVQSASASPAVRGQPNEINSGADNEGQASQTQNFASSAASQNMPDLTTGSISSSADATGPTSGQDFFIQAASFSQRSNALSLKDVLSNIGSVFVDESPVGGRTFYRVRVGPFDDPDRAGQALNQVRAAGYRDARIMPN